ncbi:translation initiation factor IF-3 [Candidatus Mycoplasma mahonii]|uniref:translation initiation factor IF-3 n=1 Tax=Candidatus Mycoplasma mahonii TaxID=3004105 RepID=UPI0026EE689A|nr:translation initiation factor IF-3 [Candidatus Mycoplasma mahonii]WKX02548.1 translation initiation factor IF-3 [Candidatus Mycoplasma mahonii]
MNKFIPFPKVFVISSTGEKLGVMTKFEALALAESEGLDLVIISNNPKQPVAKILDYGKFKYKRKKKRKDAKAKQSVTNNREIRLTPMIGEHDLMTKSRKAREFIEKGDRVKISLKFRGREMARKNLGYDKLDEFYKTLEDTAMVEKKPTLSGGRFLDMYLQQDKRKKIKEAPNAKDEDQKRLDKED